MAFNLSINMKILKKSLYTLTVIVLICYLGMSYMLSNRVLTPVDPTTKKDIADMPAEWNTTFREMMALLPKPEQLSISGFEGVELYGQYFDVSDTNKCLFIFVHGWSRTWANMLKYYPMVDDCGCDVLMYDHRAHGRSEGQYPTGGIKESEDLLLVTEWASRNKGYDWEKIAWLGSSWGAATSIIAGANNQDPAFIVADAPYQDWYSAVFERAILDYGSGIKAIAPGVMKVVNMRSEIDYREASPKEKAKEVVEPVLLIHSKKDMATSSDQSVNISKNLNGLSEFHHTQWGNDHVKDVVNNTEEMKALLMKFIEKNSIEHFFPPTPSIDTIAVKIEG